MSDTICAISTALGVGAISIIRLSGPKSIEIVNKIFKGKDLTKVNSHTIHYGFITYEDKIIDEVLVMIMKAPKTYTLEDIVEINCHGSLATVQKILEILLTLGCRLAEGGEFTKRAFLNGRIDLVQAEAVSDLISSTTEASRNLSLKGLTGKLSAIIKELRKDILDVLANIAVNIDYPEYEDAEEITLELLKEKNSKILGKLKDILKTAKDGKIIKDGINVAIVGRPNVGKSSLLNKLIEENKAIVTDIAGTTRDIVEGSITIEGIKFNFIDTAGIRNTQDKVEQIGVIKSKEMINEVDLIICVLNGLEKLTKEDKEILEYIEEKKRIIFVNKNDQKLEIDIKDKDVVYGNTIELSGIDALKEKMIEEFHLNKINTQDFTYVSNARQIALLRQCQKILENIEEQISIQTPVDMLEIDLKKVYDLLGEITGETYKDELLDELFKNFCLGK